LFIIENNLQSSHEKLLTNCISALFFLPTLTVNHKGKLKSSSLLKSCLQNILDDDNFIGYILNLKKEFFTSLPPYQFKKNIVKSISKLSKTQNAKIDELVSHGRLSKGMEYINSIFDNGAVEILDNQGGLRGDIIYTFEKLHPQAFKVNDIDSDNIPISISPVVISHEIFSNIISQLPVKSANGLSSWSNDIIKYLCQAPQFVSKLSPDFKRYLLKIINAIANGKGGNADIWIKSLLIFIQKEDNNSLRPLAIDEPFIRLASKCLNQITSSKVGKKLAPIQMGVGIQGGCEFVAHTVSMWVEEIIKDPSSNKIIIRLDKKNAFNSIPRQVIRRGIIKHCPELLSYFDWSYGSCTRLVMVNGEVIGLSRNGVRQGDPLGPLFYCLGLDQVIAEASIRFPKVNILYYLDDGFIFGSADDVREAFDWLDIALSGINQILDKSNPTKCIIFANMGTNSSNFPTGLSVSSEGLKVLGCPYGCESFIQNCLNKEVAKITGVIKRLVLVEPRCAYILVKFCINTKGGYLARICPPWCLTSYAFLFDQMIDKIIAFWCDVPEIDILSSELRSLPWGLKLPRLQDISIPAFSNSFSRALEFGRETNHWIWPKLSGDQSLRKHVNCISLYVNNFSFSSVNLNIPSQKDNSILAFENLHSHVLKRVIDSPELYSYIISLKLLFNPDIDTNCWLNWFRIRSFCKESKIVYTSLSFKSAIKFRLLIPGKSFVHQLSCGCSSSRHSEHIPLIRDPVGIDLSLKVNMFHCLSCRIFSAAGTQVRHNMVKELIMFFAESFLKKSTCGTEFQYKNSSNGQSKNVDFYIDYGRGIPCNYVEVTLFNQGSPSHSVKSEIRLNNEFLKVENMKRNQYKACGLMDDKRLFPFVVDMVGNIGPAGLDFLKNLNYHSKVDKSIDLVNLFKNCLQLLLYNSLHLQSKSFYELIELKMEEFIAV
jgi:hypothetical protein